MPNLAKRSPKRLGISVWKYGVSCQYFFSRFVLSHPHTTLVTKRVLDSKLVIQTPFQLSYDLERINDKASHLLMEIKHLNRGASYVNVLFTTVSAVNHLLSLRGYEFKSQGYMHIGITICLVWQYDRFSSRVSLRAQQ